MILDKLKRELEVGQKVIVVKLPEEVLHALEADVVQVKEMDMPRFPQEPPMKMLELNAVLRFRVPAQAPLVEQVYIVQSPEENENNKERSKIALVKQ